MKAGVSEAAVVVTVHVVSLRDLTSRIHTRLTYISTSSTTKCKGAHPPFPLPLLLTHLYFVPCGITGLEKKLNGLERSILGESQCEHSVLLGQHSCSNHTGLGVCCRGNSIVSKHIRKIEVHRRQSKWDGVILRCVAKHNSKQFTIVFCPTVSRVKSTAEHLAGLGWGEGRGVGGVGGGVSH